MIRRQGSVTQLSVEREIELTGQIGTNQMWQAYGLKEIELTINSVISCIIQHVTPTIIR